MNVDKHDSMRDVVKLRKPIDKDKYVLRFVVQISVYDTIQ